MPPRNIKKSRAEGLYKRCKHLSWEKCACGWWGRVKRNRVSLEKWSGATITSKEMARDVFSRFEAAVRNGTFNARGEATTSTDEDAMTFSAFLDKYEKEHANGLRSNSIASYISVFRRNFGTEDLGRLAIDRAKFETWLDRERTARNWETSTVARYVQCWKAIFNWALDRDLISQKGKLRKTPRGFVKRENRVSVGQEERLIEACERLNDLPTSKLVKVTPEMVVTIRLRVEAGEMQKTVAEDLGLSRPLVSQIVSGRVWNPEARRRRVGQEMRRRLFAALDMGVRSGEMLRIQVKHVDYEKWVINLPPTITKGGAITGETERVYPGTPRLRNVLTERRFLGPEAYVFSSEDGTLVESFDKSWKRLFRLAGLRVGRRGGYVWHDLRHEYCSRLVEKGATIEEARVMARHADINTTARYLTAQEERLHELAAKLGGGA